jgi:hypothetical protein
VSEAAVELTLRDLGRHLEWPPTPNLAVSVRAELDRGAAVRTFPRRPVRRAVVLAAAALLVVLGGMVALSPGLRAAILRFFSLPGVRIEVEESSPPASPPATSTPGADVQPLLGRRVSLAEARGEVGFPVAVPASLGQPDEVYVLGGGPRALVTLAYRGREGLPADPKTGYGALLTQLRGRPTEDLVKKGELESPVVAVTVEGERGYWVEGPHLVYVRAPGGPQAVEPRIAGNTLLWTRGQVTLRLEVDLPVGEALELAESVG